MGGVNDNISGTLFNTLAAAGTLLVIDADPFIFHGKGIFGTILNAAVTLDATHLADLSNGLAFFIGVTADKNPSLARDEGYDLFGADLNTVAAPGATFSVHLWCFPARPGKGSKRANPYAVTEPQAAVSTEGVATPIQ